MGRREHGDGRVWLEGRWVPWEWGMRVNGCGWVGLQTEEIGAGTALRCVQRGERPVAAVVRWVLEETNPVLRERRSLISNAPKKSKLRTGWKRGPGMCGPQ